MSELTHLAQPDAAHFSAPVCHNCGADLSAPHCGQCGQKRAQRLDFGALRSEAWSNYRVFEFGVLAAAWRLACAPGVVAREYVLGARARHVHPLKLLLIAIGVLLLMLSRISFLDSHDAQFNLVMQRVQALGNWSISLGIVAISGASLLILRWGQRFNLAEHLVLGVYVHFLIIVANVLSFLPRLLVHAPAFVAAHRYWSAWPMDAVEALIVACAFRQFFALEWRRDGWRLLLAVFVFVALKWCSQRLFSIAVIKYVLHHSN